MTNPSLSEEAIFLASLEKATGPERVAYVAAACAGNEELRHRVLELLAGHDASCGPLDAPPAAVGATLDSVSEHPGMQIGPYKLLQQIGEGGMGVVYMAEQLEPVKRRVALKIIKPGMDTRQVIARFEAERQALSLMDHPHIAKVLDAGTTESGRPYFVMELVKGQPITQYCDEHHLTPRQRLELLLPVCQAIQHAHQKGIIHRDIKPTNILVAEYDQRPVPKVIDFGVAKATSQALTEKTMFTGLGQIVGTLEYMSPEQAKVNQLDIDTRSDIYSLGVLLYELLTGSTPFNKQRLRSAAFDEMLRIIREEEPEKPSTRLSSADTLPSIAANRSMEPARLGRAVRGELDWIVMKALEKDRNRRYETANGLAMDIQRYLADEPVLAGPPSATYRLRKFIRRNKSTLAVVGLVLSFLVVLGSGVGWVVRDRAARKVELANELAVQEAKLVREQEARQAKVAGQVELILGDVQRLEKVQEWPQALEMARRAETLTVAGADAATLERVHEVLHDLAMVARLEEIRLREGELTNYRTGGFDDQGAAQRYAQAFQDFGVDVLALPAKDSAQRLRARPAVVVALAQALDDWARVKRTTDSIQSKQLWALAGAIDPDPWRVQVRQASAALEAATLVKLSNVPDTARQPPQSQLLLCSSLWRTGHNEEALGLLERACEVHPDDFWIHYELATRNNAVRPARLEAAVRHLIAARALRPKSPATWSSLGAALSGLGKSDEALACYKQAVELDPQYAFARRSVGVILYEQKKFDEAIAWWRVTIKVLPNKVWPLQQLGKDLFELQRYDEAVAAYKQAVELDPTRADVHFWLGQALWQQGKQDEAIAAYKQALVLDPQLVYVRGVLGSILEIRRRPDEAITVYREGIALAPDRPSLTDLYFKLGRALRQQGKVDEAIAAFKRAVELDPKFATGQWYLGMALESQGRLEDAIACYKQAVEFDPKGAHFHGILAWRLATSADDKLRDPAQAVALATKAVELDPQNSFYARVLGAAHYRMGDWQAAIAALEKSVELQRLGGDSYIWFFLAMAHWQLGDKEQARSNYDRAVKWMDTNDPTNEELHRFRAEAAELLGGK